MLITLLFLIFSWLFGIFFLNLKSDFLVFKFYMGKNYDYYQVLNTDMDAAWSCPNSVYNSDKNSLCVPAQGFFYI